MFLASGGKGKHSWFLGASILGGGGCSKLREEIKRVGGSLSKEGRENKWARKGPLVGGTYMGSPAQASVKRFYLSKGGERMNSVDTVGGERPFQWADGVWTPDTGACWVRPGRAGQRRCSGVTLDVIAPAELRNQTLKHSGSSSLLVLLTRVLDQSTGRSGVWGGPHA